MGTAVAPSAGTRAAAKETGRVGGRGARCMLGVVVAVAARCTAGGVVSDQFALVSVRRMSVNWGCSGMNWAGTRAL